MRSPSIVLAATVQLAFILSHGETAHAQNRLVLKSGESTEVGPAYLIVNCKSIVIGVPVIEILEGSKDIMLTFKEGMVDAQPQNCSNKVAGGTVLVTAKDVEYRTERRLTFRIKYKTKDGERQSGHTYNVTLFPTNYPGSTSE